MAGCRSGLQVPGAGGQPLFRSFLPLLLCKVPYFFSGWWFQIYMSVSQSNVGLETKMSLLFTLPPLTLFRLQSLFFLFC